MHAHMNVKIDLHVCLHTAMVYIIQVCWHLRGAVCKPEWHIPLLCVEWKTPDDGQRNCPKHVEFHFKNKFEKSMHLVRFIIRICHDIRSRGHKKKNKIKRKLRYNSCKSWLPPITPHSKCPTKISILNKSKIWNIHTVQHFSFIWSVTVSRF